MQVRPIDIIKTQEVAQIKHMENQRMQTAQDQIGKNFQKMIHQEQNKPTQAAKSDNNEYRYDAKEKGNSEYKNLGGQKKGKEKEEEKEKKESKDKHTGGIDILI